MTRPAYNGCICPAGTGTGTGTGPNNCCDCPHVHSILHVTAHNFSPPCSNLEGRVIRVLGGVSTVGDCGWTSSESPPAPFVAVVCNNPFFHLGWDAELICNAGGTGSFTVLGTPNLVSCSPFLVQITGFQAYFGDDDTTCCDPPGTLYTFDLTVTE